MRKKMRKDVIGLCREGLDVLVEFVCNAERLDSYELSTLSDLAALFLVAIRQVRRSVPKGETERQKMRNASARLIEILSQLTSRMDAINPSFVQNERVERIIDAGHDLGIRTYRNYTKDGDAPVFIFNKDVTMDEFCDVAEDYG